MTTEDKAKKLASKLVGDDQNPQPLIDLLIEMATWKGREIARALCGTCDDYIVDEARCAPYFDARAFVRDVIE